MTAGKYFGKSFLLEYKGGRGQKEMSLLVEEDEEMTADYD